MQPLLQRRGRALQQMRQAFQFAQALLGHGRPHSKPCSQLWIELYSKLPGGLATTGPLTANGETETHAHGFVALALSYAVPLLARVLPEAYIFTMYF